MSDEKKDPIWEWLRTNIALLAAIMAVGAAYAEQNAKIKELNSLLAIQVSKERKIETLHENQIRQEMAVRQLERNTLDTQLMLRALISQNPAANRAYQGYVTNTPPSSILGSGDGAGDAIR